MRDRAPPPPVEQPAEVSRVELTANPAPANPILLDLPVVAVVIDGLGVLALFVTVVAVSGVREGALVTSAVGVYVLAARMMRFRRSRLRAWHRHLRWNGGEIRRRRSGQTSRLQRYDATTTVTAPS